MLDFMVRRKLEREYERSIARLFKRIVEKTQGFSFEKIIEYLKSVSLQEAVSKMAGNLASRMVTLSRVNNEKDWRAAAHKGSMGRQIRRSIQRDMSDGLDLAAKAIVRENAKLISSVPREIAEKITAEALERFNKGMRYEDYVPELMQKVPTLMKSRAKLIARTEIGKANQAMTQVRAQNLGINCYIWRSSHDERVRHSHEMMDGVLCFWDSPPDPEAFFARGSQFGPYHAGCCPNCRCYCEPVVDMQYLPDRISVSANGSKPISMTRNQIIERWGEAGA